MSWMSLSNVDSGGLCCCDGGGVVVVFAEGAATFSIHIGGSFLLVIPERFERWHDSCLLHSPDAMELAINFCVASSLSFFSFQ